MNQFDMEANKSIIAIKQGRRECHLKNNDDRKILGRIFKDIKEFPATLQYEAIVNGKPYKSKVDFVFDLSPLIDPYRKGWIYWNMTDTLAALGESM